MPIAAFRDLKTCGAVNAEESHVVDNDIAILLHQEMQHSIPRAVVDRGELTH